MVAQFFDMADGGDFGQLAQQAAALKTVAATLELFDLCQPNEELLIDLDVLREVLASKLGGGDKTNGIFKHLRGTDNGRVNFLSYWQAMDQYIVEASGLNVQHVPGDTVHGMQIFRDGVLDIANRAAARGRIGSKDLVGLLCQVRDGALDPSYWDEVMAAVPCEDGEYLMVAEVSEAVYVWLRDFVRAETEAGAATCGQDSAGDGSGPSFDRVGPVVDQCEVDGTGVTDLLEAIRAESGPQEVQLHRALDHILMVISTLKENHDSQELNTSMLQEKNRSLADKVMRLEEQLHESHEHSYAAHEAVDALDQAKHRNEELESDRNDLKRQLDEMIVLMQQMREQNDSKQKELDDLRQREKRLRESQLHITEQLDEAEGRADWMQSKLDEHRESNASDAQKTQLLEAQIKDLETQIKELQASLDSAQSAERSSAETKLEKDKVIATLEKRIEELESSSTMSDTLNEVIKDLQATLKSKEAKLDSAQEKLRELEKLKSDLEAKSSESDAQILELKSSLEKQASDADAATSAKCEQAEAATAAAASALESATKEIDELKENIARTDQESKATREAKDALEKELAKLRESHAQERDASSSSAAAAQAAEADRETLQRQLRETEEKLTKRIELNQQFEEAAARQTSEISELKKDVLQKTDQLTEAKAKATDLENQLQDMLEKCKELSTLKNRNDELSAQLEELHAQKDKVSSLTQELSDLKKKHEEQNSKLASAQHRASIKDEQLEKAQARQSGAARDLQLLENQLKAQQAEIDLLRASRDEILMASREGVGDYADEGDIDPDTLKLHRENKYMQSQVASLVRHAREVEKLLDVWRDSYVESAPSPDVKKRLSIMQAQEESTAIFKELSQQLHTVEVQKNDVDQEFRRLQVTYQAQCEEVVQLKETLRNLEKQRAAEKERSDRAGSSPSISSTAYPFRGAASADSDVSSVAESSNYAFLGGGGGALQVSPKRQMSVSSRQSHLRPPAIGGKRLSEAVGAKAKGGILSREALAELQRDHARKSTLRRHDESDSESDEKDEEAAGSGWMSGLLGGMFETTPTPSEADKNTKKKRHTSREESKGKSMAETAARISKIKKAAGRF
eukprot:TRINITY_DN15649_c0_g1_i1.p1 TRINITY_DN15649_c0_g1~~TRINITY_DN15649_c0_g1_i1.p1  ORF type:complete len:1094 (+),score=248.83 TRINITY_DN15649_c0_g1_i1:292-3573(+)